MSTTTAAPPTFPTPRTSATYGVHSEVGVLRKVLVCAPDLAHRRLTPSNGDDLLLDDVLWVDNARRDHLDFVGTAASVPSGSFPRRRRGIVGPAVAWSGACRRGRIW